MAFFVGFLGCECCQQALSLRFRAQLGRRTAKLCRVRGGVDLLQRTDSDLRIDLRRFDVLVAEHLLDEADVRAVLVHQRCHRVAEEMA